jgi:hypothetical protein
LDLEAEIWTANSQWMIFYTFSLLFLSLKENNFIYVTLFRICMYRQFLTIFYIPFGFNNWTT